MKTQHCRRLPSAPGLRPLASAICPLASVLRPLSPVYCLLLTLLLFASLAGPAGATVPWLHVEGNQIKDASGNNVTLRGVSLVPAEHNNEFPDGVRKPISELLSWQADASRGWHSRVVRLGATAAKMSDPAAICALSIDPYVEMCVAKGLYVIIDLHLVSDYDVGGGTGIKQSWVLDFWNHVAPKYANTPNVIFEVYNEPIRPFDWHAWKNYVQPIVDAVRSAAPNNLILVGGPDWSHMVNPALTNPVVGDNIAYVYHIYPNTGGATTANLDSRFGTAAQTVPIFVTEFGWNQHATYSDSVTYATVTNWGQPFRTYMDARPHISWTGYIFDNYWKPQYFDWDWNLLGGENSGAFMQQWFLEAKDSYQPQPTTLTAHPVNFGQINLSWPATTGATSYSVKRATTSGGPYTTIAMGVTGTTYANIGLSADTTYHYVVSAIVGGSEGANSTEASATTETPGSFPDVPFRLTATGGDGQVALGWWASGAGATSYNVKRSTAGGGPYTTIATGVTTTSYTDATAANGTVYHYAVSGVGEKESPNSHPASDMPSATAVIVDNADATGVTITGTWPSSTSGTGFYGTSYLTDGNTGAVGGKSVRFTPNLPVSGSYLVSVRWVEAKNRPSNTPVDVTHAGGTATFSVDQRRNSGLWVPLGVFNFNAGTAGDVLIRNDGADGFVIADAVKFALTNGTLTVPSAPSGLSATAVNSSRINLSWTDSSGNETGFEVDRATNSTFTSGLVTTTLAANTTSHEVFGLLAGTTYHFRVRATSFAGDSVNSNPASATTQGAADTTPPAAPSGLTATASTNPGQINLNWANNAESDLAGYNVYRSSTSGGPYTKLNRSPLFSSAYNDTGLPAATTYYYVVTAVDLSNNQSANSAQASATTSSNQLLEAEALSKVGSGAEVSTINEATGSGGQWVLLRGDTVGDYIEYTIPHSGTASYDIYLRYKRGPDRGQCQPSVNGSAVGSVLDQYSSSYSYTEVLIGNATLGSGDQTIRFTVTGKNASSTGYLLTQDYIKLVATSGSDTTPPATPTGLTATAASSNQIALDWANNTESDLAGYNVYRSTTSGGPYTKLNSSLVTSSAYNNTGLSASTTYFYVVTAVDTSSNESPNSAQASATTPAAPPPPAAPSGLAATAISPSQVNLSWTDNSDNETGFELDRATDSAFTADLVTTDLGANETSHSATGLVGSTTYYFRVRATNGGGDSANSNTASATTLTPDTAPPATPTGLTAAAVSSSQIDLDWADNTEGDLAGYNVYRSTTSGGPYTKLNSSLLPTSAYSNTGLAASTTYTYVVTAVDTSNNESANSAQASATTEQGTGGTIYEAESTSRWASGATLSTVSDAAASNGTLIRLNSDGVGDFVEYTIAHSGTVQYDIYLRFLAGPDRGSFQMYVNGSAFGSWIDQYSASPTYKEVYVATKTLFTGDQKIRFTIASQNASSSGFVLTQDYIKLVNIASGSPPAAPSGLAATAISPSQIDLSWTDNSDNETGFELDRATDSAFTADLVTTDLGANETSHSATGLVGSTTYYFRVRATNGGGDSANSSAASARTPAPAPPASPTGLVATAASSSEINLDWADNAEADLAGYNVYRSTTSGGPYTKVNSSLVTSSAYADTGLSAATTYYYVVTAVDASSNESSNSAQASATTQAAPLPVVLQQNLTGGKKADVKGGGAISQSFVYGTAGSGTYQATKVTLHVSRGQNLPTANLVVSLGTGHGTGMIAGTTVSVAPSAITDTSKGLTYQTLDLVFDAPVTLTQGTTYYINVTSATSGGKPYALEVHNQNSYPGGSYTGPGGSNQDLWFQVWGQ